MSLHINHCGDVFLVAGLFLVASFGAGNIAASNTAGRQFEVLSRVYVVDREYRSMMGPQSTQAVAFPEADTPELLWITGFRSEMVGPDGETPMPEEFMCHTNLDFDREQHGKLMNLPIYHTNRLFTLSQGQLEIELPSGFGLPYWSDEALTLTTQVLNLNPDGEVHRVRHRVTIDYVRDSDLKRPMKPLFKTSGWGLVSLEDEQWVVGIAEPDAEQHGPGCLPGEGAADDLRTDSLGRRFSAHWVVKPGREVNHTRVSDTMDLPYDTAIHYIAIHLHPFAESLELVDRTEGRTVFKSEVKGFHDRIGVERVEHFSSEEGIPVYKGHEYELISVYNNTTSREQDSMAVMFLYLLDKEFEKSRPIDLSDF